MPYVITLIAAPDHPVIDDAMVDWAGGSTGVPYRVDWLKHRSAVDIFLDASVSPSPLIQRLERHLAGQKVDFALHSTLRRRKKLLIADMDSTMIGQECIDELADYVGMKDEVADITARAMNGELPFEPALQERVALLKGLEVEAIDTVLKDRITLAPGGPQLLATMKQHGAHCALVSGGFTHFTKSIAGRLGFDEHHANTLLTRSGKLTGKVKEPILGREAKVEALNRLVATLGITHRETLAVGDGANDLGMIRLSGMGVALHAKPAVAAEAEISINHGDLESLLYLQGYREDEIVFPN